MLTTAEKARLFRFIAETPGVLMLGPIYSTSGMVVPMTPDFRSLYSNPAALRYLAKVMAREARALKVGLLAGIEMAGIPLVAVTSFVSNIPMVYLRKHPHTGWTTSYIDGAYKKGCKTALVDDALTFGGQKLFFIRKLRGELKVTSILVPYAPDYPARFRRQIPRRVKVRALVTKREFLNYLMKHKLIHQDTFVVTMAQLNNPMGWQKNKLLWRTMLAVKRRGTL